MRKASPTLDRSLFFASLALLTFATMTAIALGAWFSIVDDPWTTKSLIAILACAGAIVTSFLVWRFPSRVTLAAGIVVLAFSMLRVIDSGEWRGLTFIILGSTLVLATPVVYAFLVLPRG